MNVELDHLFLCAAPGAPEAERLVEFGLTEGAPNRHPGQGTANRRFFFRNAFLELLWVDDPVEAQSTLVAPTRLWDRWSQRTAGASPFGIGFRRAPDNTGAWPFATWQYRPPYLPQPLAIEMGMNSTRADEPLLFCIAFGWPADAHEPPRRHPLDHAAGLRSITSLRITGPVSTASVELRAVEQACPWLNFTVARQPLVEVGFDGEAVGQSHDFRPQLPLLFRW